MSSADPLVEQDAQRLEALNNMLDSLAAKDTLLLEAATPVDTEDPLVETTEAERKKRDELLDSLKSGKGKKLVAVESDPVYPLVDTDIVDIRERAQLIEKLKDTNDSLLSQQDSEPKTVEEALRVMNDGNDTDPKEVDNADLYHKWVKMEASQQLDVNSTGVKTQVGGDADRPAWSHWFEHNADGTVNRSLEATVDRNIHAHPHMLVAEPSAQATSMDIPQMFGGAFILVAVVALVVVVKRRRKNAAPDAVATMEDSGNYDYQLFM